MPQPQPFWLSGVCGNLTTNPMKLGFRSSVVAIQIFVAILLREAFSDAADFIGATTITMCCIVFPLMFKVRMFGHEMHRLEKVLCLVMIILSSVFGLYTAYLKFVHIKDSITNGEYRLFSDSEPQVKAEEFPLCPVGYVFDQ